jgi:hypothetical protein
LPKLIDLDEMIAPKKTLHRAGALAVAASMLAAFAACGGDDETSGEGTGSGAGASTVFVPGSAPPMPPLPPGAGPHGPNPNPQPTSMPPQDAGPGTDATTTDGPADAAGQ